MSSRPTLSLLATSIWPASPLRSRCLRRRTTRSRRSTALRLRPPGETLRLAEARVRRDVFSRSDDDLGPIQILPRSCQVVEGKDWAYKG